MGINPKDLRFEIIRPTLMQLHMHSDAAEELLMLTCATESHLANYLVQMNSRAAKGIYQMERLPFDEVFELVIPRLNNKQKQTLLNYHINKEEASHDRLIWDLKFATIMCRLQYWRFHERLPHADNITGLATYWKKYWNTLAGKGSVAGALMNYKRFVGNG